MYIYILYIIYIYIFVSLSLSFSWPLMMIYWIELVSIVFKIIMSICSCIGTSNNHNV